MLKAIGRTLEQMASPAFLWVLARAFALTAIIFVALFWLLQMALGAIPELPWGWLNTVISFLASAGLLVAFLFLRFTGAALFLGLFLESVADAVEARYYPDRRGKDLDVWTGLATGLRFCAVMLALNAVLLPVYLLVPVGNVLVLLAVNGYLIGREYFELVALRHMPPDQARQLRRRNAGRIFRTGLVIAIPLSIPIVNLVGPLFGAALMVHVFKDIEARGADVAT